MGPRFGAMAPAWSAEQTYLVCSEDDAATLPKDVTVVNRDRSLHKVTSVAEAIEELNSGKLTSKEGYCIVLSQSKKEYFMLYRGDKEKEAYALCRKDPPWNRVLKAKTEELLKKVPPPVRTNLQKIAGIVGLQEWSLAIAAPCSVIALLLSPKSITIELVGGAYPAFAALKMLGEAAPTDAPFWLTYWILFPLIKSSPLDMIFSLVPFNFYLKLVLLVWLYYPETKGASMVFQKVIKPRVLPHVLKLAAATGPKNI